MSNQNDNEKKIIFHLSTFYYNYEKFIEFLHKNKEFSGYLIKYDLIEKFKEKILYEKLKDDIKNNKSFDETKNKITENKKIIKNIIQSKFNNSNELLNELNKNNKFYLIDIDLWVKICKEDKKNEKGIDCILNDDTIELKFSDKTLKFNINKGIIVIKL